MADVELLKKFVLLSHPLPLMFSVLIAKRQKVPRAVVQQILCFVKPANKYMELHACVFAHWGLYMLQQNRHFDEL